jgi:hypothetical protein
MRKCSLVSVVVASFVGVLLLASEVWAMDDPLPAWNDGPAKSAIVGFVNAVTDPESESFVEPDDRIATFDNDGTLWVSHPLYAQAMFALDRVRVLAARHPEWKDQEPFKSVLAGDREAVAKFTEGDCVPVRLEHAADRAAAVVQGT